MTWERVWPGVLRAAPEARCWVGRVLAGRVDTDGVEAVELVAAELVANAVEHTVSGVPPWGRVRVRLDLTPAGPVALVRVAVSDEGGTAGVPAPRVAADDAPGGRGLALVQALAERVETSGDATRGRTVAATVATVWPDDLDLTGAPPVLQEQERGRW